MQRKNSGKAMCYLVVVCALLSALAIVGCGGGGGEEGGTTVTSGETLSTVDTGPVPVGSSNVQALVGLPLTFSNGSIFDPSLGNNPATLTFTSPTTSSLASGGSTSDADTTFGSCTFTFTRGPLGGKRITFTTCNLRITGSNVTVGGGAVNGLLTLTLSGPFGSGTSIAITVQISIRADGTLLINGISTNQDGSTSPTSAPISTGITISPDGSPLNTGTGSTGTGGTP
jgi:hypothetical protein